MSPSRRHGCWQSPEFVLAGGMADDSRPPADQLAGPDGLRCAEQQATAEPNPAEDDAVTFDLSHYSERFLSIGNWHRTEAPP